MMEEQEILEKREEALPENLPEEPLEEQPDLSAFESHIAGLQDQAEVLRQQYPDFDLCRELQNPVFLQLTAPGTGISVEDAYYALHRRELQQSAARQTREKVVSAIQAGARRPQEAGTSSQAPSLLHFSYSNASKEQRDAFKKELRRAWGRGETVYPR